MTHAELQALPVTFDLRVACRAFGISRSVGYTLAKHGKFPCRVLRIGRAYRVTRADLLRELGVDSETGLAAQGI